ncbi:hypothetical protein [Methylobacterium platani]|uniref:Phasin domain-containing protein n=2 Tax=Methylobacterium platani TaxID=427683 RepID=A0A179S4J5_9HYPH|nr:hypothetical protein [Methylobacterium platani]KMO11114.1 hypothetical protein SQ03_28120 [Methylobacterium platani JCM 14648]OAS21784.1 hypothetical protein A5481_20780 [Methylobacterium platani]
MSDSNAPPLAAFLRQAVDAAPLGAGAPLKHGVLAAELASVCARNAAGTVRLLAESPRPDILAEIVAMQAAFMHQVWTIGEEWSAGWWQIAEGAVSLRNANTLSKIVEQDFNLAGQVGDLMLDTTTRTAKLIESATVGYSYWLTNTIDASRA